MGLDLDFSRIKRKTGEALLEANGWIDYSDGSAVEEELLYYRKNWPVMDELNSIFGYTDQCAFVPISKLQAYHLLHVVKANKDKNCLWSRKRSQHFITEFEALLKGFDFDEWMLTYNWIS